MSVETEPKSTRTFKVETRDFENFVANVKHLRTWQQLADLNPSSALNGVTCGLVFSVRWPSEASSLDRILDNDGFGFARLKGLAAEMKDLSATVEQLNQHPLLSPLIFLDGATAVAHPLEHSISELKHLVETLPQALAFYAGCLDESPHPILRQRVSAKKKGTEYWLCCLDQFLRRALSNIDYNEVAQMLTAAGHTTNSENISRQIRRFKQREPQLSKSVDSIIANCSAHFSQSSFDGKRLIAELLLA